VIKKYLRGIHIENKDALGLLASHFLPLNPFGHVHWKSLTRSVHTPWFLHGLPAQLSSSETEKNKINMIKNTFWNCLICNSNY